MDTAFGARSCIFLQPIFWGKKNLMSVWPLVLNQSIQIQANAAAEISFKTQSFCAEGIELGISTWW